MRAYLEIIHGRYGGKTICLEPGDICRVGRMGEADFFLADDPFLSPVHFTLTCSETQCLVYDLGSDLGVIVNEKRVPMAVLQSGDCLTAGITEFDVYVEGPAQQGSAEMQTPLRRIREQLLSVEGNRFILLDAARDNNLLTWLESLSVQYVSLYQGEKQEELAAVAPYLMQVPKQHELIDLLLRRTWGRACSVWFFSKHSMESVRKHFRHFLMVEDEQGTEMYFRFYDPRVLRAFLPACRPKEAKEFFGIVDSFIMEDRFAHTMIRFSLTGGEVHSQPFSFRTDNPSLNRTTAERLRHELRKGAAS